MSSTEATNFDGAGELAGQVALVTGSGRGLGNHIAKALIAMGADVAIHDISETAPAQFGEFETLTAAAAALRMNNARTTSVVGDITNEATVAEMVAKIEAELGPIDILVNCAGGDIGVKGKPNPNDALHISMEDARIVVERNFFGTMIMCRAIVPGMIERQRGSVVNIGSVNAHYGLDNEVAYSCAKAAVLHYTRCLANAGRAHGVRVNAVSPGPAKTARFMATRTLDAAAMESGVSLDRYAEPEEIADAVSLLCSTKARYVSGQVLRVDGGALLFPG